MSIPERTDPATPATPPSAPRHREHPERLWRELVGEQLRDIRASRGETLRDVARIAGVSPQYLSEVERGRKEPSSEMLAAISGALETPLLDLTLGVASRLLESEARAQGQTAARQTAHSQTAQRQTAPHPGARGEFTLAA